MGRRGSVMWEVVWVLGWTALLYAAHLQVIREGLRKMDSLEKLRLPYDGGEGACHGTGYPLPWRRE